MLKSVFQRCFKSKRCVDPRAIVLQTLLSKDNFMAAPIVKHKPRFHNHIFSPAGKGVSCFRWLDLQNLHGHHGARSITAMAEELHLPISLWPSRRSELWKGRAANKKSGASPAKHPLPQSAPQASMATSLWVLLYLVRQAGSKAGHGTKTKQQLAAYDILVMLCGLSPSCLGLSFAAEFGENLMKEASLPCT